MRVDEIALTGFRNYADASAVFDPGVNVISGRNAQGKTNLLEAVYILTGGKSFRTRFDRELIGFGRESAEIRARINAADRDQTVTVEYRQGRRKKLTRNGSAESAAGLSGMLTAVLFCPDDLNIIRDGAAARRRLMDLAISQLRPGYAKLLSDHARLYANKTRILRDWRDKPSLLDTLDDYSEALAMCSARLVRYRAAFSQRLGEAARPIHREFSGGAEELTVRYKTVSTVKDPLAPVGEVFERIMEHQAAHRRAELDSASCLTGAHKDDLEIEIDGKSARAFASQGQTRTAALSLKLAEREIHLAQTGEWPVLLLDDVLSELDAARREFVLCRIGGGQTLITCCEDAELIRRTGGRVLTVDNGTVGEA